MDLKYPVLALSGPRIKSVRFALCYYIYSFTQKWVMVNGRIRNCSMEINKQKTSVDKQQATSFSGDVHQI